MALLAAYALICTTAKLIWAQSMLLVAIPLGMLVHPAAGLACFAILLVAPRNGGNGTSLMRALIIYFAGTVLGHFVTLLLNKAAHDVFDVLRDTATRPNPATDLDSALANAESLIDPSVELAKSLFGPVPLAAAVLFAIAAAVIYRSHPRVGDRIFGGTCVAIVVLVLDSVRWGRVPDLSELLCLWIFFIAGLSLAARSIESRSFSRLVSIAVLVFAVVGLADWLRSQTSGSAYQLASRALASDIAEQIRTVGSAQLAEPQPLPAVPTAPRERAREIGMPPVRRVVLTGSPSSLDGAEVIDHFNALANRLEMLLQIPVIQCPSNDIDCAPFLSTVVTMPKHPEEGYISVRPTGDVLVRLQDGAFVLVPAPAP